MYSGSDIVFFHLREPNLVPVELVWGSSQHWLSIGHRILGVATLVV